MSCFYNYFQIPQEARERLHPARQQRRKVGRFDGDLLPQRLPDIREIDPAGGQERVGDMIVATLRLADALPHKTEQLARLRAAQRGAVLVTFGDCDDEVVSCCVIPDSELFFGDPEDAARPLLHRCARVLGYELFEG
jgi:hypothetical protein